MHVFSLLHATGVVDFMHLHVAEATRGLPIPGDTLVDRRQKVAGTLFT
jgi:hypothetical protein